jgi:hypothetical protein
MDLSYDEQCEDAFYCLKSVSQISGQSGYNGLVNPDMPGSPNRFRFHGKVMVWSVGPPVHGKPTVELSAANNANNKNHVLSWQ